MKRAWPFFLAVFCACAGALPAQEVNIAVYAMPAATPGSMMILASSNGSFKAAYNYEPSGKDSSCVGLIEGKNGDWSMAGTYREVSDDVSHWGGASLLFDPDDLSCTLSWKDESLGKAGTFKMVFLRMGDKNDMISMATIEALIILSWKGGNSAE
jgi:hypothetical protein